jgi:hypothetical protein
MLHKKKAKRNFFSPNKKKGNQMINEKVACLIGLNVWFAVEFLHTLPSHYLIQQHKQNENCTTTFHRILEDYDIYATWRNDKNIPIGLIDDNGRTVEQEVARDVKCCPRGCEKWWLNALRKQFTCFNSAKPYVASGFIFETPTIQFTVEEDWDGATVSSTSSYSVFEDENLWEILQSRESEEVLLFEDSKKRNGFKKDVKFHRTADRVEMIPIQLNFFSVSQINVEIANKFEVKFNSSKGIRVKQLNGQKAVNFTLNSPVHRLIRNILSLDCTKIVTVTSCDPICVTEIKYEDYETKSEVKIMFDFLDGQIRGLHYKENRDERRDFFLYFDRFVQEPLFGWNTYEIHPLFASWNWDSE